ncbi:MAG: methyl-accepting chemotaxis protein [Spirochaetes bacterium]|nr:methyl-accepting chemotaxis protein [Spirochaetota bacterium]
MLLSNLKISTKLIISSAVFLIPIGVMLAFIMSMSISIIQASRDEQEGIYAIRPAVTVMRYLPEYVSVYMGIEPGNLAALDGRITDALRLLDIQARHFETAERPLPSFLADWEELKRVGADDEEIFGRFTEFSFSVVNYIARVREQSRLILVSDMNNYYLVASVLTAIPEASLRLFGVGNQVREAFHRREEIIELWNIELAIAHSEGRRLGTSFFEYAPDAINFSVVPGAERQNIRNSRVLLQSDIERITGNLVSAVTESGRSEAELAILFARISSYEQTMAQLLGEMDRMWGWGVTNLVSVADFMDTFSLLNANLSELWEESFAHLDMQVQQNAAGAQRTLALYLTIVFVSLILAIGFVIFITRDISRSVKSLNTLFKGLHENDLTMSLPIRGKDEFGDLMYAFNGFLNKLRGTFGSFKQNAQVVADSVFDISSSSKEISTTANEQSASVSEIVSTMESNKNLSEQIAIKTVEVANLASETQDLSAKGAQLSEANQLMMEEVLKHNQKTISEMRNLSDMILRISEAIRIIDSIADQTRLIAFNASLEASSSGEAGARFSVVASEIRRFADNVVESTHEIKQRIEEVREASQTLIAAANSGSKQIEIGYERMSEQKGDFEQIVGNSQNVATRSVQISNLSKQQEVASSQIFLALKEISAGVKQFVIATSSTSKTADSLNSMSEELKEKVEKYRTEGSVGNFSGRE